jgi:hypothetical protein
LEGEEMTDSIQLTDSEKTEIPDTPEKRMAEIRQLPNKSKTSFLPQPGMAFSMGPFVYKVSMVNIGKLRFTAELADVVIEGINDDSENISLIIDPHTNQGVIKD